MNKKTYPMSGRRGSFFFGCARASLAAAGVALLASCETTGTNGVSNFFLFGTPQKIVVGEDVVLPRSSGALSRTQGVASTIRIIVDLDRQKRFAEARHLLSQVRKVQPGKSEGYRSVTNSMAILALKEWIETARPFGEKLKITKPDRGLEWNADGLKCNDVNRSEAKITMPICGLSGAPIWHIKHRLRLDRVVTMTVLEDHNLIWLYETSW